VDVPKTIDSLLMQCFGFFALGRLGAICHLIMGIGKIHTGGFVVGETKGFGSLCLKNWWLILILSG
jgi:hypothetical protein